MKKDPFKDVMEYPIPRSRKDREYYKNKFINCRPEMISREDNIEDWARIMSNRVLKIVHLVVVRDKKRILENVSPRTLLALATYVLSHFDEFKIEKTGRQKFKCVHETSAHDEPDVRVTLSVACWVFEAELDQAGRYLTRFVKVLGFPMKVRTNGQLDIGGFDDINWFNKEIWLLHYDFGSLAGSGRGKTTKK